MRSKRFSRGITALLANLVLLAAATLAAAQHEAVLYRFQGLSDGAQPQSTVIAHQGFLYGTAKDAGYGTTYIGGGGTGCQAGCGTVFQLSPGTGGVWNETVLYRFQGGGDGAFPETSLTLDSTGNLFGTTTEGGQGTCSGGSTGCGTVFELSPPAAPGGLWTENIIHFFQNGSDGSFPQTGLVMGNQGVLYGGAGLGGGCSRGGCGTVFQLSPPSVPGASWTFTTLYNFSGSNDGITPGGLVLKQGALFGMATNSSTGLGGTVFKLSPSQNGPWIETLLHTFSLTQYSDGWSPTGGIAFDPYGNIYGVTNSGGTGLCNFGCGVVFELSPPAPPNTTWTETVLHNFHGTDGIYPNGLVLGGSALYGTTYGGGQVCSVYNARGCGVVFEVRP